MAVAAQVAGDARYEKEPSAVRPGQFRGPGCICTSPGARWPMLRVWHVPQKGGKRSQPLSTKTWSSPSAAHCLLTSSVAGMIRVRAFTRLPFNIFAASRKS